MGLKAGVLKVIGGSKGRGCGGGGRTAGVWGPPPMNCFAAPSLCTGRHRFFQSYRASLPSSIQRVLLPPPPWICAYPAGMVCDSPSNGHPVRDLGFRVL